MFKSKGRQQKNSEILPNNQLQGLQAFISDISFRSNESVKQSHDIWDQSQKDVRESPLLKSYRRIKQTFYDLNSRSFSMYSYFASRLQIGKQIDHRPQLLRVNLTVNSLQILAVGTAFFFPRKYVYKILFTLMVLTIENKFMQKLMLNYFIQQFAIHNNKMQPIEQQARNLIEYKYRIHKLAQAQERSQQDTDPEIQKLLQEVDRKNIQYLKFKKVQMLF